MRKFSTLILVMFFLLVVSPRYVSATFFETNFPDVIAGATCGVPNASSPANKCCKPAYFKVNMDTGSPILNIALIPITAPITGFFNIILNTLVSGGDEFRRKALGTNNLCYGESEPFPNSSDAACICVPKNGGGTTLKGAESLCERIASSTEKAACQDCLNIGAKNKQAGIWTGIGCVYSDFNSFIQNTLLGWGIGLAGSTSLFCIIYAAFMMQISRGNAEKIKKAQELLTSCIMGLLLIIFSVFILRVIGVNILKIPGFI